MTGMFSRLSKKGFQVRALYHAEAILRHDMPAAIEELESTLLDATIPLQELVHGGGGECGFTQRLRRALHELGWQKHNFIAKKIIDGHEIESVSHEVDHVKSFENGRVALEIEWNNKDPFFDRDLDNFKRLHADGAISVAAIVTRGASLQESMRDLIENFALRQDINGVKELSAFYTPTPRQQRLISAAAESRGSFARGWAHTFVSDKFGEATTHWRKLEDRISRGVGSPCPLLLIGLPASIVTV